MSSQSSYERIEYYLGELRAQARTDARAPMSSDEATRHVQQLLALFQENLQKLAPGANLPPKS